AVVSIVQGLQFMITKEFQGRGATYMEVRADLGQRGPAMVRREVKLTWDDGKVIRDRIAGIRLITPVVVGRSQVKYGDRKYSPGAILGVNQDYQEVSNAGVDRGRFFSAIDLANRRKVVVLGQKVVDELALEPDPVGKQVYIGSYPGTVIGVMEKKGQTVGDDLDDRAFVPFDAAVSLFGRNAGDLVQLRLQARSTEDVEPVKDGIAHLLRQRHHLEKDRPDDFRVRVQDEILKTVSTVLGSVTAVVA